jgi:uncharacterized protein (TIGR02646 family)
MRRITKSSAPGSFITFSRQQEARFEGLDKDTKLDLKMSLLNEQGWICGYCQRRIRDVNRASIEHFCEQSICKERGLDYKNLMAVCSGIHGTMAHTCDKSKSKFSANSGLPIEVCPWIDSHMQAISYNSGGVIKSKFDRHTSEIDKILNLNLEILRDLRQNKFTSVFKEVKDLTGQKQKDKLRRILKRDLEKDGFKFTSDFPGLSEYMMNRFC